VYVEQQSDLKIMKILYVKKHSKVTLRLNFLYPKQFFEKFPPEPNSLTTFSEFSPDFPLLFQSFPLIIEKILILEKFPQEPISR